MKVTLKAIYLGVILVNICAIPCFAGESWQFKRSWESNRLTVNPFLLNTAADVNGNGFKELIVMDFGQYGSHIEEWKDWIIDWDHYNLFILEWEKSELKLKFHKQWDMKKPKTREERDKYFMAYGAMQMVSWQIGGKVTAETIPPYLGLEWERDGYSIREQTGHLWTLPVGSWSLAWLAGSCYNPSCRNCYNSKTLPRECLVGIRDFSGKGQPKIVTILEEEIIKDKQYRQTLRIRNFESGFPIEWQSISPNRFNWWTPSVVDPIDRLNSNAKNGLMLTAFNEASWYIFEQDEKGNGYRVKQTQGQGPMNIYHYDLPDVYLRQTQNKEVGEYWGYRRENIPHPERIDFVLKLRKVTLKSDLTGFIKEDIDFPYHRSFLSVGFFAVEDIDGDDLDEVILVEETGKKKFIGHESVGYSDIKDYIRILKWNGKEYKTMWISPPYTKRGTKFLIEDIKNTGKKQLVVLSPYGTIQIWEKE